MATILVVDDLEPTRLTICKMLKRNGYEVLGASNGNDAIKQYENFTPDVVVTDILMPDMDGLETIRAIQKIAPQTPIIAITGSMAATYLEVALKMGAVYGLLKPFRQSELLTAVQKSLEVQA